MNLQELINCSPKIVQAKLAEYRAKGEAVFGTLDRTKAFTIDEATALYLAVTGVCIDGTSNFISKLNLPIDKKISLLDIAKYSEHQWGHAAFVRNALAGGVFNLTDEYIAMGKGDDNSYSNKKLDGRLSIEQKSGVGELTDSAVGDLDIDVVTNTGLKLHNITAARNFYIRSHTSNNIDIKNLKVGNDIRMVVDTAAKITGEMAANYNCIIGISSCETFEFDITARLFDIDISSAANFLLRPNAFDYISYRQSTAVTAKILLPYGYKINLTGDLSKVKYSHDITDKASKHAINVSISTGRLVIETVQEQIK